MNLDMQKYLKVRMAQGQGARTVEELKSMSDIVIEKNYTYIFTNRKKRFY